MHPPPKTVPETARITKTDKNMHAQQPKNVKPIIVPTGSLVPDPDLEEQTWDAWQFELEVGFAEKPQRLVVYFVLVAVPELVK